MKLTEKQLQMQNAILMAVHKTDDIEEAKRKELKLNGCMVRYAGSIQRVGGFDCSDGLVLCDGDGITDMGYGGSERGVVVYEEGNVEVKNQWIIGLPPFLPRVLSVLDRVGLGSCYIDGSLFTTDRGGRQREYICERNLLLDNGQEASLRDQSEETQEAIHQLLCKND